MTVSRYLRKESSRRALREARNAWSKFLQSADVDALNARLEQLRPALKDTPLGSILQRKPIGDGAESTVYPVVRSLVDQPVLQVRKMLDPDGLSPAVLTQQKIDHMRSINLPKGQRFATPLTDVLQFPGKDQYYWNQEFIAGQPASIPKRIRTLDVKGRPIEIGDLHNRNVRDLPNGDRVIIDPLIADPSRPWVTQGMRAGDDFKPHFNRQGRELSAYVKKARYDAEQQFDAQLKSLAASPSDPAYIKLTAMRDAAADQAANVAKSTWVDDLISLAFGKRAAGQHAPIAIREQRVFSDSLLDAARGITLTGDLDALARETIPFNPRWSKKRLNEFVQANHSLASLLNSTSSEQAVLDARQRIYQSLLPRPRKPGTL